jgi:hypothetical protein
MASSCGAARDAAVAKSSAARLRIFGIPAARYKRNAILPY